MQKRGLSALIEANQNKQQVRTHEGGVAYNLSPKEQVVNVLCLGLIQNTFYSDQDSIIKLTKGIYTQAVSEFPDFLAKAAIYARNDAGMKLQPIIALVYLSLLREDRYFRLAFPKVIKNPNDLHKFIEICRKVGIRKGLGRKVKRVINYWLASNTNAFTACRYKGRLNDVLQLTHPNPLNDTLNTYYGYITGTGNGSFERANRLEYVLNEMNARRLDGTCLRFIREERIQLEEIKSAIGKLSKELVKDLYMAVVPTLSYSALIHNLASIERVFDHSIPRNLLVAMVSNVSNYELYKKSMQGPIRLLTASVMVRTQLLKNAIQELFNKIKFECARNTSVLTAVDVSGSMNMHNLTPSLTAMDFATFCGAIIDNNSEMGQLVSLSNHCVPVMRDTTIINTMQRISSSQRNSGTDLHKVMEKYHGEKVVIVITDSEQFGDIERYWLNRKESGAKLIVWQVVTTSTKVSNHDSVIYVNGYNESALDMIEKVLADKNMVEIIEEVVL